MKPMFVSMVMVVVVFCTSLGAADPQVDARTLQSYAETEKHVSDLEWNLLQFNLAWHNSFGDSEYVKSSLVHFDYQKMVLTTSLRVADKRSYNDPEPFSSLSTIRQRAVLQEPIDHLVSLLKPRFPNVNALQEHIEITFVYRQTGGGSTTVATYRDGKLKLAEQ